MYLNDFGIILEIIGFVAFLLSPKQVHTGVAATDRWSLSRWGFLDWELPRRIGLPFRFSAIFLVAIGLILQLTDLQNCQIEFWKIIC